MAKKVFFVLFLAAAVLASNFITGVSDAEAFEKTFSEDYDRVWDAAVAVITEKGFSEHPHKKMKTKKSKGRIKTPEWRYFKIWSASPVVEKQYKDSYKINLKKIETEVPKPAEPEAAKPEGTPPAADPSAKPATPATPAAKKTDVAAKPADGAPAAKPGEEAVATPPPPPVETITKVKVIIKRKFLVHNDETRKWVKGDPKKEKVGYSVEALMEAIEAKMAEQAPAVDKAKLANLNITPPPINHGPPPVLK